MENFEKTNLQENVRVRITFLTSSKSTLKCSLNNKPHSHKLQLSLKGLTQIYKLYEHINITLKNLNSDQLKNSFEQFQRHKMIFRVSLHKKSFYLNKNEKRHEIV